MYYQECGPEFGLSPASTELPCVECAPVNSAVLVLNQNYEPLNICNVRRAFVLVDRGKAEVLEHGQEGIRTASRIMPRPSVIKLGYLVKRPRPQVRLSRREIFLRDDYTCQYCGAKTRELTLDHVVPKHRGGGHSWDNLVSACRPCNHRKGSKALEETRMRLIKAPRRPQPAQYFLWIQRLNGGGYDAWLKFLPQVDFSTVS
ncbi:MAG: HNH endonuclease [Chloroflexi bacterium]|nr:HNH endonuclease [Chloroflexota bacterium]